MTEIGVLMILTSAGRAATGPAVTSARAAIPAAGQMRFMGRDCQTRGAARKAIESGASLRFRAVPTRRPSDSASVLTHWTGVLDANTAGFVHGGVIMRLCD